MEFFFKHKRWLWPLITLLILTPFLPAIDIALEAFFFKHGNDPDTHFLTSPLIRFMYHSAVLVPVALGVMALPLVFLKRTRRSALIIVLTLVIGDLVIVESVLKRHWGRPRPKQIEMFGGDQPYRPWWEPNFNPPEPLRSFPSSHAAVGFLFLSGVVLSPSKKLFWGALSLTLLFGVGISLTRMAQGGHYFSDCLIAGLIMWWTALTLNRLTE